jgi:hypothetical protein
MKESSSFKTYVERKLMEGDLNLREEGFLREKLYENGRQRRAKPSRESRAEWIPPGIGPTTSISMARLSGESYGDQTASDLAALADAIKSRRVKAVSDT